MITIKNLQKNYKDLPAVNDISLTVEEGEVFGLLGPNGAGKSTTIEILTGVKKPDKGIVTISGFNIKKQLKDIRKIIGVQLQFTSLFELLTVKEIIKLYASFYKHHIPVETIIKEMLLDQKKDVVIRNLSGGQKQRLVIALALINDPLVVFLDEPTTGLDPHARRKLWEMILFLKKKGKTIFLTTHYMDEAFVLCDKIGIMDHGSLIALDTPGELINQLQYKNNIEFKSDVKMPEKELLELKGVDKVSSKDDLIILYTKQLQYTLIDLIQYVIKNQIYLHQLNVRTPTLEDVFIHKTGRGFHE